MRILSVRCLSRIARERLPRPAKQRHQVLFLGAKSYFQSLQSPIDFHAEIEQGMTINSD
jgi:hypothetical protein